MAITWGSGEGSGNLFYVGIDVSISGLTATVSLYVKSQYSVSDQQSLSWSNVTSGSRTFYHDQPGGFAVLVKTLTIGGANSQTITLEAALSGVYNGAAPTHSVSFTYPPATIEAPDAPASLTATFVSDSTTDLSWPWPITMPANKPISEYRVERYDYNNTSAGYVYQGNFSGLPQDEDHIPDPGVPLSARLTNGVFNTRYAYRIRSQNTAGESGWTYASPELFTTPRAPSDVTLTRLATGDLAGTWTDLSPHNIEWEVQWQEGTGSWSASTLLPNATSSATKATPSLLVSHKMRIRSKVEARVSAWVESNTLRIPVKPHPPASLSGGVVDPAREIIRSWAHNAIDGSEQQGSQTRYRLTGSPTWIEQTAVNTSDLTATWAANFFTTGSGAEWQVRTKGAHADWSDWSATAIYTFATTPVVAISQPAGTAWSSPVFAPVWSSSQTQAQWQLALTDADGFRLENLSGSGTATTATFSTRLVHGAEYTLTVESRSSVGLWSDPVSRTFTASFPVPAKVSVAVTWDEEHGWATCRFTAAAPVGDELAPDQADLWRSDTGAVGTWELVAQAVPLNVTITDTEPAVDGKAMWVARARNTTYGTEVDGPPATTEITSERGYLSAGPGYESSLALIYGTGSDGPTTSLSTGKPNRAVVTLDGGTKPRRVLIETPEIEKKLSYTGRLYGATPQATDTRDLFETIAQLDGPHLYRDPDGRKLYGALSVPDITRGVKRIWWDIGFSLQESDHDRIIGEVTPA